MGFLNSVQDNGIPERGRVQEAVLRLESQRQVDMIPKWAGG